MTKDQRDAGIRALEALNQAAANAALSRQSHVNLQEAYAFIKNLLLTDGEQKKEEKANGKHKTDKTESVS